jgi:hypothetical protein
MVQFFQYEPLQSFGAVAFRRVGRSLLKKPAQSGVFQFEFEIAFAHFRRTRELRH